jgi:PadR family transcriptional regulator PadR
MAVLDALADEPARWRHGYDLCRSLGLKAGTVYPILIRLAERGQVDTEWERDVTPGRPRRHLYRLSRQGIEVVAELRLADRAADRTALGAPTPALGRAVK